MNYKKNLVIAFIILCSATVYRNLEAVLTVSQYKPDSFFQKPYFVQDNFANISAIFSGGFASQAYAQNGQKVPYLQQFGTENLLKKFTDPSLSPTNIDSFGQGLLQGNFHVREVILSCYKNMVHGFFIEGAIAVQDLSITNIAVEFAPSSLALTQDQINYMQSLQQQIPHTIGQSGMFTTAYYAGYSKTFSNFTHLDFIDLTVKIGFTSPAEMSNTNTSIVQFPFTQNINFGYPIIATSSLGILDWMTIGCNGSVILWQPGTKTIAMNNTNSGNNLLISQHGVATIERGPLFTTSIYIEADHFHQNLSTIVGYCYTQNSDYTIIPLHTTEFPQELANQSALLKAWSFGSLYMQFDVDFACESKPSAPVITVFCNIPLAGKLCPKTTIFGSSCSLQCSYVF